EAPGCSSRQTVTPGAASAAQLESSRQNGPRRCSSCHSHRDSSSGVSAHGANTGVWPPSRLPGQPLIVTTVETPSRWASSIAPRTAAAWRAPISGSGWSGLPAAFTQERPRPCSRSSPRSRSRADASRRRAFRSRWPACAQPPTPISMRPIPRSAHQANACSRGMCASPSLNTPICNRDSRVQVETFQPIAYLLPRISPCQVASSPIPSVSLSPDPSPNAAPAGLEAVVMGRAGVYLYPMQLETPLEEVEGFHKYVGGFAANVATGLARLGVRVAIVSAVGDDGHGRFVRRFLESEGVDCRWLSVHPSLRTALAFCEAWPPDRFPITFYRTPTCPDWELTPAGLDVAAIAAVPLAYVSGTGLAHEPSRL